MKVTEGRVMKIDRINATDQKIYQSCLNLLSTANTHHTMSQLIVVANINYGFRNEIIFFKDWWRGCIASLATNLITLCNHGRQGTEKGHK